MRTKHTPFFSNIRTWRDIVAHGARSFRLTGFKIYTWEDIRRQILENMEREGLPTEGISAGSSADAGSVLTMAPMMESGAKVGSANAPLTCTMVIGQGEEDSGYFLKSEPAESIASNVR